MGCRRVFCVECSTKIDGINTCLSCLKAKVGDGPKGQGGWFLQATNVLFGLAGIIAGFIALVSAFTAFGLAIPKNPDAPKGNRVFANLRIVEDVAKGLEQFRTDVGRYPTEKEGFRALDWPAEFGKEPSGYAGPYFPERVKLRNGEPLDSYGTPLRYIEKGAKLPSPAVVSAGGDRVFETDAESLLEGYDAKSDEWKVVADGDDTVRAAR